MQADCRKQPDARFPTSARERSETGFTLVELIVTVSIAGILTSVALSSFTGIVADQRVKGVATDLYVALSKARSEALKRNANVTLSPKTASQWTAGWQIPDPADATRILDDHAAITNVTITGPANVAYRSSGRISGTTTPTFDISATGTSTHLCVSVDLSGRPYQKGAAC